MRESYAALERLAVERIARLQKDINAMKESP
jgi:hypothetical protein